MDPEQRFLANFRRLGNLEPISFLTKQRPTMALTSSAEEYGCKLPMSALAEGEFSDLTIRCRNKDHAVHKVIVCSQSKFFRAACVNNCIESKSGIIDLSEDDPEIISHLVTFLYTSVYPTADLELVQLPLDITMYTAADRYDIPSLSAAAKKSLNHTLDFQYNLRQLMGDGEVYESLVKDILGRFMDVVPDVYESTLNWDRGLRDMIVKYAALNGLALREACEDRFRQLILDVPDFAWDLIGQLSNDADADHAVRARNPRGWSEWGSTTP